MLTNVLNKCKDVINFNCVSLWKAKREFFCRRLIYEPNKYKKIELYKK